MFGPHDDNGFFPNGEYPFVLPDADRAWQDMRGRLEERPLRRSIYWVWIVGLMILGLGFAWLRFPGEPKVRPVRGAAGPGPAVVVSGMGADEVESGMRSVVGAKPGADVLPVPGVRPLPGAESRTAEAELVMGADPVGRHDSVERGVDSVVRVAKQVETKKDKSRVELQEERHMLLLTGLEWAPQVPTANAGHYFTGPTGRDQVLRLLIPAVWMQVQSKGSLLEIAFAPSFSKLIAAKTFSDETNSVVTADSSVTTHTTKALDKLFGVAFSINYAAALGGNWWAGGGVRADWWKHVVATVSTAEDKFPLNNPATTIRSSFSSTSPLSGADWSNFSRFQLDLSAQLLYKTAGQQAGLRISMPFTPLNNNGGAGDHFRAELFYRHALFGGKIK
jgi:hypothetical protein